MRTAASVEGEAADAQRFNRVSGYHGSRTPSHSRSGSRSPVAAISMIASATSSVREASLRHCSPNRSHTLLKAIRFAVHPRGG
jgi:hypothetical protein